MIAASASHTARLSHVSLTYSNSKCCALDDLSLDLAYGERVCILGANGSGKSTLSNVLAGLAVPDAGIVELDGCRVFDGSANEESYRAVRKNRGLVFQIPEDQIITTRVCDDIAFGPENQALEHDLIVRRVDAELERMSLMSRADADPTQLSGGQQQRVTIAGILALTPRTLIFDEPSSRLDVRGHQNIMHIMNRLKQDGITIIHITHSMDEALFADRVIVMHDGRIALDGTPDEVFDHAEHIKALNLELPFEKRLHIALESRLANQTIDTPDVHEMAPAAAEISAVPAAEASAAPAAAEISAVPAAEASAAPATAEISAAPATAETKPILAVEHVSHAYDDLLVLDDISFTISHGESVALIGQTGSGKTTLMRFLCALARPDQGSITVCGINTATRSARTRLRPRIGYVMQRPERQLFAATVYDDVAFGPQNFGYRSHDLKHRVMQTLELLELAHLADRSPFELSGGQKRLVAIAGILAYRPEVLVLDEPMTGLDPSSRGRIHKLLRRLSGNDTTIIFTTHSMDEAAYSDRLIVLEDAHLLYDGTPSDVFSHHKQLTACGLGIPQALAWAYQHDIVSCNSPSHQLPLTLSSLVTMLTQRETETKFMETFA